MADLNNHLFEEMERLNDEDLQGDDLEKEIKRANAMAKTAHAIIANNTLALNAKKHFDEYGISGADAPETLRLENKL
jgi:hypothetical protein